jgi:hypothetical protein
MLGIGKALGTAGGVKDGEELSMLVTSPRGCLTGATGSGWLGSADEMSPCGAASGSSSVHLSTKLDGEDWCRWYDCRPLRDRWGTRSRLNHRRWLGNRHGLGSRRFTLRLGVHVHASLIGCCGRVGQIHLHVTRLLLTSASNFPLPALRSTEHTLEQ